MKLFIFTVLALAFAMLIQVFGPAAMDALRAHYCEVGR